MSLIGFAKLNFEDISKCFSDYECVLLDFSSNPLDKYNSISNKSSKVFVLDVITGRYLAHKLGNVLKGFFVFKDSFFNLKTSNIKCLDLSSTGLVSIEFKNKLDLNYLFSAKTKFNKELCSSYEKKGYDSIVSSLLSKKKIKHSSLTDLLDSFKAVCSEKNYKELLCRALTNNISYSDLDKYKDKFSPIIKKFLNQHSSYRRAVIAFQDMMYNLTDIETAVSDMSANREEVEELLSLWNPNPKVAKEIKFPFNKKPLPKAKQTPKRLEKWKKQKHDIPKAIFHKRKEVVNKNKRKHLVESSIDFIEHESGLFDIKDFINSVKEKANLKDSYYVIGSLKEDKILLRKNNIISLVKKNSNDIVYVRIV